MHTLVCIVVHCDWMLCDNMLSHKQSSLRFKCVCACACVSWRTAWLPGFAMLESLFHCPLVVMVLVQSGWFVTILNLFLMCVYWCLVIFLLKRDDTYFWERCLCAIKSNRKKWEHFETKIPRHHFRLETTHEECGGVAKFWFYKTKLCFARFQALLH